MSLSSSSSMLNFYFCKVSLFFLVILPSFNCVPSLHHSSNLLSKNLPVLLLNNIKKYLDLAYIFFLPPNFSYKMYIQKSMYNLKNNKISDHVLINKIKNCFFFMLSTVNPHHLQIQPTQDKKYSGEKILESSKKQNLDWSQAGNYFHSVYTVFITIYKVFTLY